MNTELLRSIGLTDSEIKVYLALLELGSTTKGPIVDKSKVASSKVYELLEKLQQKGLVSSIIEAGMKYFEATPPTRLLDYMKEKQDSLTKQRQELQQLIPELELQQKYAKHKSEATIYRGLKGVKTAYEDILNTLQAGDEYYVTGGMVPHSAYFTFIEQFHKRRAKKGIKVKLLYTELVKSIASNIENLPGTKIKFVPQHLLSSCFVVMYKTKTLITVASEDDLTLFKIDSKGVTESFMKQFKLLWKQDVSVVEGFEGMQQALQTFLNSLKAGETWDVLGATFGEEEKKFAEIFTDIHKQRREKGIKGRMLFQQQAAKFIRENKGNKTYNEAVLHAGNTIKYLPYETQSPVAIFPSAEKTLLVIQKKTPVAITIENKEVAQAFKKHFEQLWNQSEKIV